MTKRQEEFEQKAHQAAVNRLRVDLGKLKAKKYLSASIQGKAETEELLELYVEGLIIYFRGILESKATTTAGAIVARPFLEYYAQLIPFEALSVIVIKTIIDYTRTDGEWSILSALTSEVTARIEDECRFSFYHQICPEHIQKAMERRVKEQGSSPQYRRDGTRILTNNLIEEYEKCSGETIARWIPFSKVFRNTKDEDVSMAVGLFFLDVAYACGIVEYQTITSPKDKTKTKWVRLHEHLTNQMNETFDEVLKKVYQRLPLIEPPIPWSDLDCIGRKNRSGGYHTSHLRKQFSMSRGFDNESRFGKMSVDFLNTNGGVAWQVDRDILELSGILLEKGISVESLDAYIKPEKQPMPPNLVALETDDPLRVAWRTQQRQFHKDARKKVQKTIRTHQSRDVARMMSDYARFYLSWSCDARGRVYTQQPWLSPHSTGFEKALLKFADGKPLDDVGLQQVHIALGAAFLGTSDTLDSREQWAKDNKQLIETVGRYPESYVSTWEGAKEPWQFVQLCIEYVKVVIERSQTLWYVGLQLDATCSGLQLLSSILRDEQGMRYSNVIPTKGCDKPQDAYMEVLRYAQGLAVRDGLERLLPFMQERGVGKTFMVLVYGAKLLNVAERIRDVLNDKGQMMELKWEKNPKTGASTPVEIYDPTKCSYKDCFAIGKLIIEASDACFPKAFKALNWLKELGKLAAENGTPAFFWETPAGDEVRLIERHALTKVFRTSHLGKCTLPIGRGDLNYPEMIKAFPPGFVHSLDATLLKIAFQGWKEPLSVIHDCVVLLPADIEAGLNRIRGAFHETCKGDPLAELADKMGISSERLPRMVQGEDTLLSQVHKSRYLFN